MGIELKTPAIYLITNGQATNQTLTADCDRILALIDCAVMAAVSLIQIREKNLSALSLFELTKRAAKLTWQSSTKLLVNDRADIASTAGADGVHLTSRSLKASDVRRSFGDQFLIGVSTHSLQEALAARDQAADFAVFGPIFDTPSKSLPGKAQGLDTLRTVALAVSPFPIIALGGVTRDNASLALGAGASGVAAIRALGDPEHLDETVQAIRNEAVLL